MTTTTAWDLIGAEGEFVIEGGHTVYSDVVYVGTESTVKLAYLKVGFEGIHQVNRYVDPDTPIVVLRNYTAEYEAQRDVELAELRAVYG